MTRVKYEEIVSPKHDKNEEIAYDNGAEYVCAICGKAIKNIKTAKMIHLLCSGYFTLEEQDFGNNDQGWFSVGANCYKKFLKMYNK